MKSSAPIATPAGYASAIAVGFADSQDRLAVVGRDAPLPIVVHGPPAPPPLQGSTDQSVTLGPFAAAADRTITVTLSGEWTGQVRLLRSTDGGATLTGLSVAGLAWGAFTGPCCEQVWHETEAGVGFYLAVELVTGTIAYRVSQ